MRRRKFDFFQPSSLCALGIAFFLGACPAATVFGQTPSKTDEVLKLSEGTNIAVALSPNRGMLTLLFRGGIFTLPMKGGEAQRIVDEDYKARMIAWSSDGREVIFASVRDGAQHLYAAAVPGGKIRRLTDGSEHALEPSASPTTEKVLYVSASPSGRAVVREMDLRSGASTAVDLESGAQYPTYAGKDDIVYVVTRGRAKAVIKRRAKDGAVKELYTVTGKVSPPAVSADGTHILYSVVSASGAKLFLDGRVVSEGEDVFLTRPQWVSEKTFLYTADGHIKRRDIGGMAEVVPFSASLSIGHVGYERTKRDFTTTTPHRVLGITRPMEAPNGEFTFGALGDIWSMQPGSRPRDISADDAAHRDGVWSPDGKSLLFSSDRAGDYDLWIREGATGNSRRLTSLPGAEIRGSWSPDGKTIVFVHTREQVTDGQIWVVNVASGKARMLVDYTYGPGYPVFSGDGKRVLFPKFLRSERDEGGFNQLYSVPVRGGPPVRVPLFPVHSVTKRTADGPAISPDGQWLAFEMKEPVSTNGLLDGKDAIWLQRLTPDGNPSGEARKLINVSPEYLAWSRDGRSLTYLNADKLQRINVEDRRIEEIPIDLTWSNAIPKGRLVIHAGRLLDGVSEKPRADVDVIIDGNVITAIEPHEASRKADRVIDASNSTVMPGLIETHVHFMLDQFGRRLERAYLAYGITTIRSTGAWPYEMLAARETWASGRRPGPRLLGTGYIFEGSHFFGHDPTVVAMSDESIAAEIERARRLDYDWIKTYELYPANLERKVIEAAHRVGLPVTGHELYPAAAFGKDGVEHLEYGIDDKLSPMLVAYDDVIQIMRSSQIGFTPTIADIFSVLDEDPQVYTDPRWRSLLKPFWDDSKVRGGWSVDPNSVRGKHLLSSLRRLYDGGAFLLVGTDSPYVETPFGITTHGQLEMYVRAGLTPFQALRAATVNNAKALNVDVGSIQVGKLADLVVVDGDPLKDIHDARKIVTTIANGVAYSQESLLSFGAGADRR